MAKPVILAVDDDEQVTGHGERHWHQMWPHVMAGGRQPRDPRRAQPATALRHIQPHSDHLPMRAESCHVHPSVDVSAIIAGAGLSG
jgi:hypothetical protein